MDGLIMQGKTCKILLIQNQTVNDIYTPTKL